MIQIDRIEAPLVLAINADFWKTQYLLAIADHNSNPTAENRKRKDVCRDKYRNKDIKDALISMFSGKCAYCESQIDHVDWGHIEHFFPKGRFPERTFDWDNLLLSCGKCNSVENKGEKFPDHNEGGPLVNPVIEIPSDFFTFSFDNDINAALVKATNLRGETTKDIIGLNRIQLLKRRTFFVRKIIYIAERLAKNPRDSDAKRILKEALKTNSEYSAFTKEIVDRLNLVV